MLGTGPGAGAVTGTGAGREAAVTLTGATARGPAEPMGFGPGVAATPCWTVRTAIFTWEAMPGVDRGTGEGA